MCGMINTKFLKKDFNRVKIDALINLRNCNGDYTPKETYKIG